jgi:hypothetical protein
MDKGLIQHSGNVTVKLHDDASESLPTTAMVPGEGCGHPVDAAADAYCDAVKAERQAKDAVTSVLKEQAEMAARVLAANDALAKRSQAVVDTRDALEQARVQAELPARLPAEDQES